MYQQISFCSTSLYIYIIHKYNNRRWDIVSTRVDAIFLDECKLVPFFCDSDRHFHYTVEVSISRKRRKIYGLGHEKAVNRFSLYMYFVGSNSFICSRCAIEKSKIFSFVFFFCNFRRKSYIYSFRKRSDIFGTSKNLLHEQWAYVLYFEQFTGLKKH